MSVFLLLFRGLVAIVLAGSWAASSSWSFLFSTPGVYAQEVPCYAEGRRVVVVRGPFVQIELFVELGLALLFPLLAVCCLLPFFELFCQNKRGIEVSLSRRELSHVSKKIFQWRWDSFPSL